MKMSTMKAERGVKMRGVSISMDDRQRSPILNELGA